MQFFWVNFDFSTHDVRQKDGLPCFAKSNEKNKETVTLETKMVVIRIMEAGEKRADVCSSLSLAPATVSTIMVNTEKIKTVGTEN